MARPRTRGLDFGAGLLGGPRSADPAWCDWAVVVGLRVRTARRAAGLTLVELSRSMPRPGGGGYSGGYISRIERGAATAPLHVYLSVCAVLGLDPGRLLGPDDAKKPVSDAELTLLQTLRELGMVPHEALARLARPPQSM